MNAERGTSSVTAKTATVQKFTREGLLLSTAPEGIEEGFSQEPEHRFLLSIVQYF